MDIDRCPFCLSYSTKVVTITRSDSTEAFVLCSDCHASGPHCESKRSLEAEQYAAAAWNNRPRSKRRSTYEGMEQMWRDGMSTKAIALHYGASKRAITSYIQNHRDRFPHRHHREVS